MIDKSGISELRLHFFEYIPMGHKVPSLEAYRRIFDMAIALSKLPESRRKEHLPKLLGVAVDDNNTARNRLFALSVYFHYCDKQQKDAGIEALNRIANNPNEHAVDRLKALRIVLEKSNAGQKTDVINSIIELVKTDRNIPDFDQVSVLHQCLHYVPDISVEHHLFNALLEIGLDAERDTSARVRALLPCIVHNCSGVVEALQIIAADRCVENSINAVEALKLLASNGKNKEHTLQTLLHIGINKDHLPHVRYKALSFLTDFPNIYKVPEDYIVPEAILSDARTALESLRKDYGAPVKPHRSIGRLVGRLRSVARTALAA